MPVFLNPDRPEITRFLGQIAHLGKKEGVRLVQRYMRSQNAVSEAAAFAHEAVKGSRSTMRSDERAYRVKLAAEAMGRVPALMRHLPEEMPDGEYLVPLRGIAEQATSHAVLALLVREDLPPRVLRTLLSPFEGLVDPMF
jgi:hypothetical protein